MPIAFRWATVAATAFLLGSAAQVYSAPAATQVTPIGFAVQMGAEAFVIHSQRTGRNYLIEVTSPPVNTALPGQKLPAIIALDAGYGLTGPVGRILIGAAAMDAAYMVAVGYPIDQPNMRTADLTHQTFQDGGRVQGGGGSAFQAFLTEELKPWLAARYAIDPQRLILFGHSLGGLFTANVLASQPDAFSGYLIGSPSVQRDDSVVVKATAAASRGSGRRVIVAVGGKEPAYMITGAERIAVALSSSGSTFRVEKRIYAGETHLSYYPTFVAATFPLMLPRSTVIPDQAEAVVLDPNTYGRYLGVYRLADGRTVVVTARGEKLMGQMTGLPLVELTPQTATRFFIRGADAQVTFEDAGAAPAPSLVLRLNGASAPASRAN